MKQHIFSFVLTLFVVSTIMTACVSAAVSTSTPTSVPQPAATDDLLNNDTRSVLTFDDLFSGLSTAAVDDSAFALPTDAAMPDHIFEGQLELSGEAINGGFSEVKDILSLTGTADDPRKHLPEFRLEFIQDGSYLIPVQQGLSYTGHAYWNYIVGPGRVWQENGDNDYSRAAFPFALVQRNANCTHNGVMTFLFNDDSASKVRY
ncbi:MAG: hypothetical protein IPJ46_02110 [Anaerolineales bacterium]|nr:hypothetical protein [Anaerolineales bacterium]